jgi:heterodisulfide reductase subunit A
MSDNDDTVLVVGGGIAGIKATLDLGGAGLKVHLVEREPSIGGKLVQLHRMYPSMTSPMEAISPMMSNIHESVNVTIHTLSEVKGLEGGPKARCTNCGKCYEVCPVKDAPDRFNAGLSKRTSIHMLHPHAVPNVPLVDNETCLHFKDGPCKACQEVCGPKAIDLEQKEQEMEIDVAAVVVATGFDLFDCTRVPEYGFNGHSDVFTSMEYERMSHPAGPTGGRIRRRTDGKEPASVAWIQCVGSRNTQHLVYCCSVGCMNSIKAAMHIGLHTEGAKAQVFYKDLRCYGKGFNEVLIDAEQNHGVEFINSDATVSNREGSDDLIVTFDRFGKPVSREFEMVVLAMGTMPSHGTGELARALGIETTEHGFFKSKDRLSAPCESTRPGVFIAGFCHEPKIISEAVSQGEAAAGSVVRFLAQKGGG